MRTVFFFVILCFLTGCVSRSAALYDYQDVQYADSLIPSQDMAILCVVVDGLSTEILQKAVTAGNVPNLSRYFLRGGKIHLGRAVFPSITYPNISSILTGLPISGHGIVGNQMRFRGEYLNFEKPQFRTEMNTHLAPRTVFTELSDRGLKSVSLAHYFRAGATVHYHTDVEAAVAYLSRDYAVADEKLISSLTKLLADVPERAWPFFTFLHVAGIDSFAHDHGPSSPIVQDYLRQIDERLGPVIRMLEAAEAKGKKVTAILTADHGFTEFESNFNADQFLATVAPGAKALNETRFASIYFQDGEAAEIRENILGALETNPEIELYAERRGNQIHIDSAQLSAVIEYVSESCPTTPYGLRLKVAGAPESAEQCPEQFDRAPSPFYSPYFVSSLAAYFHSAERPDALLLAAPGVSFATNQKGGHGGITADELQVPVLLHNATIKDESMAVPTFELLKPIWRKIPTRSARSDQTVPRSGRY